jgi:hypothetical protein
MALAKECSNLGKCIDCIPHNSLQELEFPQRHNESRTSPTKYSCNKNMWQCIQYYRPQPQDSGKNRTRNKLEMRDLRLQCLGRSRNSSCSTGRSLWSVAHSLNNLSPKWWKMRFFRYNGEAEALSMRLRIIVF